MRRYQKIPPISSCTCLQRASYSLLRRCTFSGRTSSISLTIVSPHSFAPRSDHHLRSSRTVDVENVQRRFSTTVRSRRIFFAWPWAFPRDVPGARNDLVKSHHGRDRLSTRRTSTGATRYDPSFYRRVSLLGGYRFGRRLRLATLLFLPIARLIGTEQGH
jgi:hypothetical protein